MGATVVHGRWGQLLIPATKLPSTSTLYEAWAAEDFLAPPGYSFERNLKAGKVMHSFVQSLSDLYERQRAHYIIIPTSLRWEEVPDETAEQCVRRLTGKATTPLNANAKRVSESCVFQGGFSGKDAETPIWADMPPGAE